MLHAKKVWLIDNMVCHEGGLKKKKNNLCEASEKWNNSFIPSRFQGTPGKKLFLPHHRCTSPDKWHSQRWSCCSANQRLRSCSRAVPCLWPWTFLSPSFPEPGWPFCSSSSVERRVWHSVRGGSSTFETNIWLLQTFRSKVDIKAEMSDFKRNSIKVSTHYCWQVCVLGGWHDLTLLPLTQCIILQYFTDAWASFWF